MTRIFEGFLASELSKLNHKIGLEMIRLDPGALGKMDYCEYYLGLFCSKEQYYKMNKSEIYHNIFKNFDFSLTILENFVLKIGFAQSNHKSEIEYLNKEIGKRKFWFYKNNPKI